MHWTLVQQELYLSFSRLLLLRCLPCDRELLKNKNKRINIYKKKGPVLGESTIFNPEELFSNFFIRLFKLIHKPPRLKLHWKLKMLKVWYNLKSLFNFNLGGLCICSKTCFFIFYFITFNFINFLFYLIKNMFYIIYIYINNQNLKSWNIH